MIPLIVHKILPRIYVSILVVNNLTPLEDLSKSGRLYVICVRSAMYEVHTIYSINIQVKHKRTRPIVYYRYYCAVVHLFIPRTRDRNRHRQLDALIRLIQ